MKIIVCCGSPASGFEQVADVLYASGLSAAIPVEKDRLTPLLWHDQVYDGYHEDSRSIATAAPISPGKLWEQRALEILQANLQQDLWGWSDHRSSWLLEFWSELDPQIYFILTYTNPEEDYARHMLDNSTGQNDIGHTIGDWLHYNRKLLQFYNKNRERSILINAHSCMLNAQEFVKSCNDRFGVALNSAGLSHTGDKTVIPAIACSLAQAQISDRSDVKELFLEIEATATFPAPVEDSSWAGDAWAEYRHLLQTNKDSSLRLTELEQNLARKERLISERLKKIQEQDQKLEQTQGELNQLRQVKSATERVDANEISELKKVLEAVKSEKKDIKSENDLILLQLHQVQEELEHYFLLYQEKQTKETNDVSRQPEQREGCYTIQMDEMTEGENWYGTETHVDGPFRWTGPGVRATINLPVKWECETLLVIEYRDTLTPDQLEGLRIEVGGVLVPHTIHKKTNPRYIAAKLPDCKIEPGGKTEIALILPRTVTKDSISDESSDQRPLGLAVNSISVVPAEPGLRLRCPVSRLTWLKLKIVMMKHKLSLAKFPLSHFDGASYLEANPDVVGEVHNGRCPSALAHYLFFGYDEHRKISLAMLPHFDEASYLKAYPDVADAVRDGRFTSALSHYVSSGYEEDREVTLAVSDSPSEGDIYDLLRIENK